MSKLIRGIGFNSKGKYKPTQNGKRTKSYSVWRAMMERAYNPNYYKTQPTYKGCSIDERWHDYQVFAEWYANNKHSSQDYQLDKDLLVEGNKVYSPDTCCLVPQELNCLLTNRSNHRGDYPQGVHWDKFIGKFKAQITANSATTYLGVYDCPNEAYQVYKEYKEAHVKTKALEWQDRIADNVFQALMNWKLS